MNMSVKRTWNPAALLIALILLFPVNGLGANLPFRLKGINEGITASRDYVVLAADNCNWAKFIADISVPDGTTFNGGAQFTKTWRLKNIGSCTWTEGYSLMFSSGEQMAGPQTVNLPYPVPPDKTLDISVNLTAPSAPGSYRGYWILSNADGLPFGIGAEAARPFWVDVNVNFSQMSVITDFALEACSATWFHLGGRLPCPTDASQTNQGFVSNLVQPVLETGLPAGGSALLTYPAQRNNEFIQGIYPRMDFYPGDRFQAQVGCEYQAVDCLVTFLLEYRTADDEQYILWSTREKFDGMVSYVDLDLSRLSWKKGVQLILTVSANGSAFGDRALWVKPVVVRPSLAMPPTPTPAPELPPANSSLPSPACDSAALVADVSFPEGSLIEAGAPFTKTWRVQNSGTCTWTSAYNLTFSSGQQMGGPVSLSMLYEVLPGQTVDLSINLIAPVTPGTYSGLWVLRNSSGSVFGIGLENAPIRVSINVQAAGITAPASGAFDFVAGMCSAAWSNNQGALPCPGVEGDGRGFVLVNAAPALENGLIETRPGLLTHPQEIGEGYIQGIYPAYSVQSGDRFQATVGCEWNATDCMVVLRLDYQIYPNFPPGDFQIQTFWAFIERYEGMVYNVDLDLSPLAGQSVKFILTTLGSGSPSGDRALWVAPQIIHSAGNPIQTAPPTQQITDTATPDPALIATESPTTIPIAPAPPGITRVLIVSYDGLRPEVLEMAWMPALRGLMRSGAFTLSAQTIMPSTTLPAHSSMLVGTCPVKHGVYWNEYFPENGYARGTDLFDLAHAYGYETVMVAGKEKLRQITEPTSLDILRIIDDRDLVIAEKVTAGFPVDFGLMFVHFPMLDVIGHNDGWLSEGQLHAAVLADRAMGLLLDELEVKRLRDETLVIVTADHGGHNLRHGTSQPEDMTVPWIASGPGVISTMITAPVYIMDTAATAAYALGLPIPEEWDGEPVSEIFGQLPPARQTAGCP